MTKEHHINLFADILDNSGVRLFHTTELRPVPSAQLMLAFPPTQFTTIIPPKSKMTLYGYCPGQCTRQVEAKGIQIYAGLLHTHLAGTLFDCACDENTYLKVSKHAFDTYEMVSSCRR